MFLWRPYPPSIILISLSWLITPALKVKVKRAVVVVLVGPEVTLKNTCSKRCNKSRMKDKRRTPMKTFTPAESQTY